MAKKDKAPQEEGLLVDVEQSLTKTEQYLENNWKKVVTIAAGVTAIVLAVFAYQKYVAEPANIEAGNEAAQAIKWFEQDSLQLALEGNSASLGLIDIIDEYGSTPTGKSANYYAGMAYLQMGDFENAIAYLDDYKKGDVVLSAMALGGIGDAFMELGQDDDALDYYMKAAKTTNNNFTTPMFLQKAAMVNQMQGNNVKALKLYQRIADEYPDSRQAAGVESIISSLK